MNNNIFTNIHEWKKIITETCSSKGDGLDIICIQGLYGYRTGLLGKLLSNAGCYLSKFSNPNFLKCIGETHSNDYEIVSFALSVLTRNIPFNNLFTFDLKDNLNLLYYMNKNFLM